MFVVALRRESSGRAAACGAGGERAQWAQIAAARGRAVASGSQRPSPPRTARSAPRDTAVYRADTVHRRHRRRAAIYPPCNRNLLQCSSPLTPLCYHHL